MIHFDWLWILLLTPLPWVFGRLLPAAAVSAGATLYIPFTADLSELEGMHSDVTRHPGRYLAIFVWLLLLMAAARPQWLGEPIELPEAGRNLMFALDASGSMETPDLDINGSQASRLEVIKQVAGDFIERREGDRVGLILFGSQAYLQSPLSFDRVTVKTLLDQAMIGIAGRETAIGDAIGLAVKRLRHAPEGRAVLILLTDGANTAGEVPPRQAAELAAQAGLRVYTIGVGADRMRVRGLFGSQTVNPSSGLDESTLRAIAETTGGSYFRARDREGLTEIYQRLDQLEPVEEGSREVHPVTSLYPWPLGAALLITLIWGLVALSPPLKRGAA